MKGSTDPFMYLSSSHTRCLRFFSLKKIWILQSTKSSLEFLDDSVAFSFRNRHYFMYTEVKHNRNGKINRPQLNILSGLCSVHEWNTKVLLDEGCGNNFVNSRAASAHQDELTCSYMAWRRRSRDYSELRFWGIVLFAAANNSSRDEPIAQTNCRKANEFFANQGIVRECKELLANPWTVREFANPTNCLRMNALLVNPRTQRIVRESTNETNK